MYNITYLKALVKVWYKGGTLNCGNNFTIKSD